MINIKNIIILVLFILFLILSLKDYDVENFENNKKIYIIANNKNITKNKLKKIIKNDPNHTYVFFNHIGPLNNFTLKELQELNNFKCNKILFMRENHHNSFWGKREFDSKRYMMFNNNNSFIIPSRNGNLDTLKNPNNLKIKKFKNLIPKEYPNNKEPQTGFIAYHILKKNNNEITLVGFTRKHGEDPADWFHEKNFELEYYRKNNIPIIII